jgi:hypothetical protein
MLSKINMFESSKGISLVIMILGVIVLMIISLFVYLEFFSFSGGKDNINFSKEGNLLISNSDSKEGTWCLSYAKEGVLVSNMKLFFNEKSVCKNETNLCSDLVVGERVEIRGLESNGEVLVKGLKLIENLN